MTFSIFKDQEMVLRILQGDDLFKKYFKPLVGLKSDNYHGIDLMQYTVATVRSIENVLTELKKTQNVELKNNEIRALHTAALFYNTGKAKVKVEIQPNEFDYKGYAEASEKNLSDFYNFIKHRLPLDSQKTFELAIWLVREHANFNIAIKTNNLRKWIVDNIKSKDFETRSSYPNIIKIMIVLSAAEIASLYATCDDEYHDAIIRFTAERYAILSKVEELNIPVHSWDILIKEGSKLDEREAERILHMCWGGKINNTIEQVSAAIAIYRANKKYTVSIDY